jgi:hypothetical protein
MNNPNYNITPDILKLMGKTSKNKFSVKFNDDQLNMDK